LVAHPTRAKNDIRKIVSFFMPISPPCSAPFDGLLNQLTETIGTHVHRGRVGGHSACALG
jgi:hypothetical protein